MTQTRNEVLAGGGVNRAQRDYWETDGPRQYQQFGDTNEALLGPAGEAMLDAAQLRPGERVLDVGCGFGTSTLEAAERVAPSGRVVGVDISAAMLQRARQRVAAEGVDNVELLHADAQAYAFEAGSFDPQPRGGRCHQPVRNDVLRGSAGRLRQPCSGAPVGRTASLRVPTGSAQERMGRGRTRRGRRGARPHPRSRRSGRSGPVRIRRR
jgi:SAM-dependent methyltransferase